MEMSFINKKILNLGDKYNFKWLDRNIFKYFGDDFEEDLVNLLEEINLVFDVSYGIHFTYTLLEEDVVVLFPDFFKEYPILNPYE